MPRSAHFIDSRIETAAAASSTGQLVHSSNDMVMSASRSFWISIERSGVSRCCEPSIGERKVTPSASSLRRSLSDITWKPPESVRIGPGQFMNLCSPPSAATRSAPGRSIRWKVLPSTISAPVSATDCGSIALIVPAVPSGMKAGVSTVPCAVRDAAATGGAVAGQKLEGKTHRRNKQQSP